MHFQGPHRLLWCFASAWAVCFFLLLVNDGTEQNPVLMILALTELAIHAVWILLDQLFPEDLQNVDDTGFLAVLLIHVQTPLSEYFIL